MPLYSFGIKSPARAIIALVVLGAVIMPTISAQSPLPPCPNCKKDRGVGLGFAVSGKIKKVYVKVGDSVKRGKLLAELDPGDLFARLRVLNAGIKVEEAKLQKLEHSNGVSAADMEGSKSRETQLALENARRDLLENILPSAYSAADDAVRNKVDQFFINLQSPAPQPSFAVNDPRLLAELSGRRSSLELVLASWKTSLGDTQAAADVQATGNLARNNLNQIKDFFSAVTRALSMVQPDAAITANTIRNWRLDLSSARNAVDLATKNIIAAQNKVREAEFNFNMEAIRQGALSSGVSADDLAIEKALIEKLRADAELLQTTLGGLQLRASFSGTVKKVVKKAGMTASANSPLIFISPQQKVAR